MMPNLPKRMRGQIIGDVAESRAVTIFREWGWTSDSIPSDYGEDLECYIFIENQRTSFYFRCQVKSFEKKSYVRLLKSGDYRISIKTSTARSWVFSYYPVFIIIYDVESGELYWADAISQIKDNLNKLTQKSITLNVSHNSILKNNREEIFNIVQKFYTSILRMSNLVYDCNVYPVIMPEYRLSPYESLSNIDGCLPENISESISVDNIDTLPSWLTIIQPLIPKARAGWNFSSPIENLDDFIEKIRSVLISIPIPLKSHQWISFIWSPIKIKSADNDSTYNEIWERELTGWWSYLKLNSTIVSDLHYTFELPRGFLQQIARHASSWPQAYHVDPKRDLAIEMLTEIPLTPSVKEESRIYTNNIISRFIPWICPKKAVSELITMLELYDLHFKPLQEDRDYFEGIIYRGTFEPDLGLISMPLNWDDFISNNVQKIFDDNKLVDKIPGKLGSENIRDYVLSQFEFVNMGQRESFVINESEFIPGMPINHKKRTISVARFRELEDLDIHKTKEKLLLCANDLSKKLNTEGKVHTFAALVDKIEGRKKVFNIYGISIEWTPDIIESSSESFDRLSKNILETFNDIFPPLRNGVEEIYTTYDILRYVARLYFKGEDMKRLPRYMWSE